MKRAGADRIEYGIDAPAVLRNFFLIGGACMLAAFLLPAKISLRAVTIDLRTTLLIGGSIALFEGLLYLNYVKRGKYQHRDLLLQLYPWRGEERVLDVGCGRGLLLVGAAKRLTTGTAVGIDVWSDVDLSDNSEAATLQNIRLERVADRTTVFSMPAQEMTFASGSFDVVVSNLCLHNIYDRQARFAALAQIARVLRPGGTALLSDYKLTGEYANWFREQGWQVSRRWGSPLHTFPPLRIVIARKPD